MHVLWCCGVSLHVHFFGIHIVSFAHKRAACWIDFVAAGPSDGRMMYSWLFSDSHIAQEYKSVGLFIELVSWCWPCDNSIPSSLYIAYCDCSQACSSNTPNSRRRSCIRASCYGVYDRTFREC